jgi:hypothetical protein
MLLTRWQRRFVDRALAPETRIAALSLPRGCGKTALSGWLGAEALDPAGRLYAPRSETIIVSASLDPVEDVVRVQGTDHIRAEIHGKGSA